MNNESPIIDLDTILDVKLESAQPASFHWHCAHREAAIMNILLADDDPDDRHLIAEAMQEANAAVQLDCVADGHELLQELGRRVQTNRLPQLILLDLNMPRKPGVQTLIELRATAELRHLPLVILSTSRSADEVLQCHRLGANAFMSKPDSFQALVIQLQMLTRYWFHTCQIPRLPL